MLKYYGMPGLNVFAGKLKPSVPLNGVSCAIPAISGDWSARRQSVGNAVNRLSRSAESSNITDRSLSFGDSARRRLPLCFLRQRLMA